VLLVYPWQEDRHQLYCTAPVMVTRYTSELPSPSNKEYRQGFSSGKIKATQYPTWTQNESVHLLEYIDS